MLSIFIFHKHAYIILMFVLFYRYYISDALNLTMTNLMYILYKYIGIVGIINKINFRLLFNFYYNLTVHLLTINVLHSPQLNFCDQYAINSTNLMFTYMLIWPKMISNVTSSYSYINRGEKYQNRLWNTINTVFVQIDIFNGKSIITKVKFPKKLTIRY